MVQSVKSKDYNNILQQHFTGVVDGIVNFNEQKYNESIPDVLINPNNTIFLE